jgi:cytochrome c551/c552
MHHMKHINKILIIFFSIILLLAIIITIEILNRQEEPEHFYCGVKSPPQQYDSIMEPIHDIGGQLFKENCKACHKLFEDAVGPSLSGITSRRPKKWLYAFVKNSDSLIRSGDTMAINIYTKYGKCIMTSFPTFTESEIDSIFIYIESVSHVQAEVICID